MAITYKKNAQNVYKVPLYAQFWTWWALVLALAVLSLVMGLVVSIKLVQVVLWALVAILTIWRAYSLTKSVIKAKTIGKYSTQKKRQKKRSLRAYLLQCQSIVCKDTLISLFPAWRYAIADRHTSTWKLKNWQECMKSKG